ncbi:MAG: sel1 repeat family protein [Clostridia bacterium]|nr:sel1 repeat family protein [Clostridia bacterium]
MNLLANTTEIAVLIFFVVVGVFMVASVIVGLYKVIHGAPVRSGKSSSKFDDKLYDNLSADELYTLAKAHIDKTAKDPSYILGKKLMLKAAKKGHAQAQFYYADNFCFDENSTAIELLEKAAAQGVDEAAEKLGDIYHYGRDVGEPKIEENPDLALKYYLPLAEKGNVEVQKTVARIYCLDYDDDENEFKWNLKAAQAGDIEAIGNVVDYYDMKDDLDNAVLWCKKFIDGNGEEALYRMGRLYEFAEPADMDKAVCWYKRAADEGDIDAEVKLGTLYLEGDGLPKNEQKAIEIFKARADEGNKLAIVNLGECYYKGAGVARDYKKAFGLLSSVKSTFDSAKYYLALMYLDGNGVDKNPKTAYDLLVAASEYDDGDVLYKLGECCFFGTGCESDKPRARELWRTAADNDSKEAVAALDRYFGEKYVPKED